MEDCIFCKIIKREIPTDFILENDNFVVFPDIHPSAPTHLLIVSKKHITDFKEANNNILTEVKGIAEDLEKKLNLKGFRLAVNSGDLALIKHLHVHFLAGFDKEKSV